MELSIAIRRWTPGLFIRLAAVLAFFAGLTGCAHMPDRRYTPHDLQPCLGLPVETVVDMLRLRHTEHSVIQALEHNVRGVTHYIADGGWVKIFVDPADPSLPPPVLYDPNLKYEHFRKAIVQGIQYVRKKDYAECGKVPLSWRMGREGWRKIVIQEDEWHDPVDGDEK